MFENFDNAQALAVVLEPTLPGHQAVERSFPGMAKRRVPKIVRQRDGLGEVLIEPQGARNRARDLSGLHRVGQTRAEIISLVVDENLSLVLETSKRRGMDNPVSVTLERGAQRVLVLGVIPAAAPAATHGIRCQRTLFVCLCVRHESLSHDDAKRTSALSRVPRERRRPINNG